MEWLPAPCASVDHRELFSPILIGIRHKLSPLMLQKKHSHYSAGVKRCQVEEKAPYMWQRFKKYTNYLWDRRREITFCFVPRCRAVEKKSAFNTPAKTQVQCIPQATSKLCICISADLLQNQTSDQIKLKWTPQGNWVNRTGSRW